LNRGITRVSIVEWRALLDEAALPNDLRDQIRGQVDHIEWLLGNLSTFGPEPVAVRSRELVGTAITALVRVPRLAKRLGEAIIATTTVLTLLSGAEREAAVVFEQFAVMTARIEEMVDGGSPRQIERVHHKTPHP